MIEIKDIERLAELARIRISPEEVDGLRGDIGPILDFVNQVKEVTGAADLEPWLELHPIRNVMRPDENPHESGAFTEDLLAAAPRREGNYFKVKKILGGTDTA